ncbi:hypothetical protein [Amycolatopsis magusensis]|uniref:hypothetical protein n=1 Tax=Amycolatopsis magusensis TaxID=882444 RepID=UPI0037B1F67F
MTSHSEARTFDLYSILAVTHGLPIKGAPYRAILEFLSGLALTGPSHAHGIAPRCARELREQHPQLDDVPPVPDFHGDEAAMDAWAAEQAKRIGADHLPVRPLPRDEEFPPYIQRLLDVADPAKVYIRHANGSDQ